ncbi:hypothetical protein BD779DRAFT_1492927 [Infundibulicybe gibba]|nr:hypothetical protein BD779DRAFT_1492927 [Infundibulicybe gibba]
MNEPWGASPRTHERLGSLYDLSQFSPSQPPSPSPFSTSRSASPLSFPSSLSSQFQQHQQSETMHTPPSLAGGNVLRLSVEPPTPERFRELVASPGKGERHIRMTETLRSRTHRWADGRFGDSLIGQQDDGELHQDPEQDQEHHGAVISRPATPLPQRLLNTFDAVVDTISARPEFEGTARRSLLLPTPTPAPADTLHAGEGEKKKGARLGAVLLELWLWLQFAVIILVFLWAMARRGPKAVLGDAQHRRVSSERVR